MSNTSMDVFSLRDSVVGEYRKFATSFTTIYAEDIRAQVEAIYSEGRFWQGPLLPGTADILCADGAPLFLFMHVDLTNSLPVVATRLDDQPHTACVAACYRCMMSYFNQPDHEPRDRREKNARALLPQRARGTLEGSKCRPRGVRQSLLPSPRAATSRPPGAPTLVDVSFLHLTRSPS